MNKIKKYFGIILLIIFLVFIVYFFYNNISILEKLKNLKPITIFLVSVLIIFSLYINGLFLYLLGKPFNIEIKNYFLLSNTASFLNLVTPFRGGAGFRAWYMKKKYNLDYSYFASSLFGNYVIVFFVSSFLAILNFIYLYYKYGIFNLAVFLTFVGLFLIFGFIFFTGGKFYFKKENKFTSKINKVLKGWELISKDKVLILKLSILQIINIFIGVAILYLLFKDIGVDIEFFKVFYISIISILSIFINITPGSIGITEGLYMLSSGIVSVSITTMLLIALLKRGLEMIVLFVLGLVSKYLLLKKFF